MKGLSRHEQTIAKATANKKMSRTAMRINKKVYLPSLYGG